MANDDPILTTMRFIPQHKFSKGVRFHKVKPEQAPEASSGKRLKLPAEVTNTGKKKQPAKGLETLSEITLTEAEQMKLAHEGTGVTPGVPDVPIYVPIYGSSDKEDDDDQDDDKRTESDNDGDDFVHPKLSTHDDEARKDDEVNEEESNEESNDESNEESG
ncbi:hypothetical protein Tco_0909810 [Tanacetum coccineum]|uniref:Uncharacterized protein n=1 Tax=Tanacetum coccineum TaxID=301880 RepID=A0ABQ5CR11_9ASTR